MNVVVFDLDDTLYKEVDYVKSAFCFIAGKLNCPKAIDILWRSFQRGDNAFENCNRELNLSISLPQYLEWYRYHEPSIILEKSVISFLDFLKNSGCILGIITDGRAKTQMNKFEALNLSRWIKREDVIISETFGSSKPSEANYRYFMDRFGDDNTFFYIGDNLEKDFLAPNRLKWETICLLDDGRNIHKQNFDKEIEYLPKRCIRDFSNVF